MRWDDSVMSGSTPRPTSAQSMVEEDLLLAEAVLLGPTAAGMMCAMLVPVEAVTFVIPNLIRSWSWTRRLAGWLSMACISRFHLVECFCSCA